MLEEVFAANGWRELGLYPLLWEAARREMSARLRDFVAFDISRLRADGFRPRLFEARLRGAPQGASGDMPWRGVADRIDAHEDGRRFRVADYKTKRSARWRKGLAALAERGESHQIPFYAELSGRALGEGWDFAGGELLFLEAEDDEERLSLLSAAEWEGSRGPFLKTLAGQVDAIAAGRFPIRPQDGEGGHCAWCDFPTLCRKGHGPSRARAARLQPEDAPEPRG